MTPRIIVAAIALLASAHAAAQFWRADMEYGQDGGTLVLAVLALAGWVAVRDGFKKSRSKGYQAIAICVAVAGAALLFPPVAWLLTVLVLGFLLYVLWQGIMGR